ncbi:50S ribosomal protein L29 [uncultured Alistipes sp.]|uniref:50S ribosomal protein L29 n=1 Tax=uncultured Alistipes sp. TaxID=538949 RepID=UPI002607330E|nr:50S ribosomal protein L29 [uncultured Alistipes sp.]
MKTSEIRELTVAEIAERIEAEKTELLRQKLNHAVSPVENPTTLKKARRDIARMLTILAEKQNVKS